MIDNSKLYVVMVGLPAMGKSTIAAKIKENLENESIRVQIFNNGDVRRLLMPKDSSHAGFYDPGNKEGVELRERIARINMNNARDYLAGDGEVAVLDATNASRERRRTIEETLTDHPILFVGCVNDDEELLAASITRKTRLPEFSHLTHKEAYKSFEERINYYRNIHSPFDTEENYINIDSLNNKILTERVNAYVPYYPRIRDLLVSDWVKNLFLARHGETHYNLELRIGGDSELTPRGLEQAKALGMYFRGIRLPYVFTSSKVRTRQMAQAVANMQDNTTTIPLDEFDEIDAGVCEDMTYTEIAEEMPEVYKARARDKYNYVYPEGEGYVTLRERVNKGLKKALYLSGNSDHIMIIGHQAINRMILSHFLYRRTEDVPYIYIPQDKYFHIVSTQNKKLFQLNRFMG
jgi:broad specificity phosphatase PhoE/predicted kinase